MLTSPLPQTPSNADWWTHNMAFTIYGLRIGIRFNRSGFLEHLANYLPPGREPIESSETHKLYSVAIAGDDRGLTEGAECILYDRDKELARSEQLEEILDTLDSDLRLYLGTEVRDRLFVHAGVVSWRDRAIVIPGRSFSGKTTLVAALVQAGATYYSDEYAIFDENGLVHPYPRSLSIRQEEGQRVKRCPVEELGGKAGTEPIPVGLIVNTHYQPEARWCPHPISPGEAVLELLDNTLVARLRPDFALPILARVASGVPAIQGDRGDSAEVAIALLQQLEAAIS